jgi:hypothetical protein
MFSIKDKNIKPTDFNAQYLQVISSFKHRYSFSWQVFVEFKTIASNKQEIRDIHQAI